LKIYKLKYIKILTKKANGGENVADAAVKQKANNEADARIARLSGQMSTHLIQLPSVRCPTTWTQGA
jgi:hypothetical protein